MNPGLNISKRSQKQRESVPIASKGDEDLAAFAEQGIDDA